MAAQQLNGIARIDPAFAGNRLDVRVDRRCEGSG
jgi:hypothetical protein